MLCSRARTALSARLDEEALPPGVTARRLDEHLHGCPACRRWEAEAGQLGRLAGAEAEAEAEADTSVDADRATGPDRAEQLLSRLLGSDGKPVPGPGHGDSGRAAG